MPEKIPDANEDHVEQQRRVEERIKAFVLQQPPDALASATELAHFLSSAIAVSIRAGDGRSGRRRVYPWTFDAQCLAANARLVQRAASAEPGGVRRVYENYARQAAYRHLPLGADLLLGNGADPKSVGLGLCSAYIATLVGALTIDNLRTLGCQRKAEAASLMFTGATAAPEDLGTAFPAYGRGSGEHRHRQENRQDHWRSVESAWREPLEQAGREPLTQAGRSGLVRGAFIQAYTPITEIAGAMRRSVDGTMSGRRLEEARSLLKRAIVSGEALMFVVEAMDQATPAQRVLVNVSQPIEALLATLPSWQELEPLAGDIQPLECLCLQCYSDSVGM